MFDTGVLTQARTSRLVRNTGSLLVGHVGKVALQGVYFVIIARSLGVNSFGAFAGAVALIALVAPFASLGSVSLMIRSCVRLPARAPTHLATAISVSMLGSIVATGLVLLARPFVAPPELTWVVVACVALADLVGARLVEIAGAYHAARERMVWTAAFSMGLHAARTLAAVAMTLMPVTMTLTTWAYAYAISSVGVGVTAALAVSRSAGRASPDFNAFRAEWREGLQFSIGLSAQSVYNDIDKVMLARLSTLGATGLYTAAYRVVDMAFAPARAIFAAAHPRFFRHGELGIHASLTFARSLSVPVLLYCLAASVGLFAAADLVPLVLGQDYSSAVPAIRALAILPLLKALHYLPADVLTGTGYQGARSASQVGIAVVNVLLNAALIVPLGFWGAVISTILCELLLGITLWIIVVVKYRNRPVSTGLKHSTREVDEA